MIELGLFDTIKNKFCTLLSPLLLCIMCFRLLLLLGAAPGYNRNGRLGVKHQVTYLVSKLGAGTLQIIYS